MPDDPYTADARLCDDSGLVSDERVTRGAPGTTLDPDLTYRRLLDNLRRHGGMEPYTGEDFRCTGSAHLAREHFRCTSPWHNRVQSDADAIHERASMRREGTADVDDDA